MKAPSLDLISTGRWRASYRCAPDRCRLAQACYRWGRHRGVQVSVVQMSGDRFAGELAAVVVVAGRCTDRRAVERVDLDAREAAHRRASRQADLEDMVAVDELRRTIRTLIARELAG